MQKKQTFFYMCAFASVNEFLKAFVSRVICVFVRANIVVILHLDFVLFEQEWTYWCSTSINEAQGVYIIILLFHKFKSWIISFMEYL